MKKMVCEICGSQKFKKENGIFTCLECGTEYSAEEAKKLLTEINLDSSDVSVEPKSDELSIVLIKLKTWLDYILKIEKSLKHFNISNKAFFQKEFSQDELKSQIKYPTINRLIMRLSDADFIYHFLENYSESDHPYKKQACDNLIFNYLNWYFSEKIDSERLSLDCFKLTDNSSYDLRDGAYLNVEGLYPTIYYGIKRSKDRVVKVYSFVSTCNRILSFPDTYSKDTYKNVTTTGFFGKQKTTRYVYPCKYDVDDILNNAASVYKSFHSFYEEQFKKLFDSDEIYESLIALRTDVHKYENVFNLPVEYRNSECLINMINNLLNGKANSWKEVALLQDEEIRTNKILDKIDNLEETINNMSEAITSKLGSISNDLQNINSSLLSMSVSLSSIAYYSASMDEMLTKNTFYQKMITWSVI